MKLILFALVFASPPFLKSWLLRTFAGARIDRRAQIGWFSAVMARNVALGEHSKISPLTLIRLDGDLSVGAYSEISSFNLIYGSSDLRVGEHCYVGPQSLINVEEPVQMGNGSALGPRSMVFTHGSFLPFHEGYWSKLAGVTIGNKVWCAAGVFIHPGVEIGDDSFVNSRAVVTQSIPPGSVVEGNPATVICPMDQVKRRVSPRRVDALLGQILEKFAEVGLARELAIDDIVQEDGVLSFTWARRRYQVVLVPSVERPVSDLVDAVTIYVNNRPGWAAPAKTLCLDMTTLVTPFDSDPIHEALRLFMKRYYGIQFRDG